MVPKYVLNEIVIQPTSLCNLNCRYCYLPERTKDQKMSPTIIARLAQDIENLADPSQPPIQLLWHGGEPLACGYEHFTGLLEPLEGLEKRGLIKHSIQTNGTLLNKRWCELFAQHQFNVGLSLDGPIWASKNRVDWQGREAYSRIIRGINLIKEAGFPLQILSVFPQAALS